MNDANSPLTHDEDVMDTTSNDDALMSTPADDATTDDAHDDAMPAVAIPDTEETTPSVEPTPEMDDAMMDADDEPETL